MHKGLANKRHVDRKGLTKKIGTSIALTPVNISFGMFKRSPDKGAKS